MLIQSWFTPIVISLISLLLLATPHSVASAKFVTPINQKFTGSHPLRIAVSAHQRPINPNSSSSESELDRYFRIAYEAATGADFDTAIINYHKAEKAATTNCEASYAQAGEQTAYEAKQAAKKV